MGGDEFLDLRFRLVDGTDLGPNKYGSSTTVTTLKEKILALWPKDKENGPRTINDIKLINGGRILENNKTLTETVVPLGEVPGGVITMHVVVRPPNLDKGPEKPLSDPKKKNRCFCTIL